MAKNASNEKPSLTPDKPADIPMLETSKLDDIKQGESINFPSEKASVRAGFTNRPCIVRNLTDEKAITQIVQHQPTRKYFAQ